MVYLIDFEHTDKNSFQVINQWTFIENTEKRADIIVFVNGLPLVVVELKSPSREETDASEAYLHFGLNRYVPLLCRIISHSGTLLV